MSQRFWYNLEECHILDPEEIRLVRDTDAATAMMPHNQPIRQLLDFLDKLADAFNYMQGSMGETGETYGDDY